MAEPGAYTFVPHFRRGPATLITDGPATEVTPGGRASVDAVITMGWADTAGTPATTPLRADKALDLLGPGDVKGLQPHAVLRTHPADGARQAGPDELAFVEFYDEDLPWRLTPAAETTGPGDRGARPRLQPWLALLVLADGEYELSRRPDGSPVLTVAEGIALPPADGRWAWAHAQLVGAVPDPAAAGRAAEDAPDLALSRLLSPRRLDPGTAYAAFVVPAFETGRRRGLGLDIATTPTRAPSWGDGNRDRRFPIYHSWRFTTGEGQSFEALVRRLQARAPGAGFGQRTMRVDGGGLGLDPGELPAEVGLEGALQPPSPQRAPYPDVVPGGTKATEFAARLDLGVLALTPPLGPTTDGASPLGDDPIVVPPLYGAAHAGVVVLGEVVDDDPVGWVRELNLDPRNRAAAGLGARIVREQQEELMTRAWAQVGRLRDANQRVREGALALEAATTAFTKHAGAMDATRLLLLTAAAHTGMPAKSRPAVQLPAPAPARAASGAGTDAPAAPPTVRAAVAASRVPTAIEEPAFRAATRPARALLRRSMPGSTGVGFTTGLLTRMDADTDRVSAAPPLPTHPGAVGLDDVQALAGAAAAGRIAHHDEDPKRVFLTFLADLLTTSDWSTPPPIPTRDDLVTDLTARVDTWAAAHPTAAAARLTLLTLTAAVTGVGPDGEAARVTLADDPFDTTYGKAITGKAYRGVVLARHNTRPDGVVARMTDADAAQAYGDGLLALSGDLAVRLDEVPGPPGPLGDTDRLADDVRTAMKPDRTVYNRVVAAVPALADHLAAQARIAARRLTPVMVHPTFDDPMIEALQALSQDYVLPNLTALPTDTLTLMEPNRRFIEAFLAGLNTEFARELLWREYPTDQRGSHFRVFWDRRGAHPAPASGGVDVPPLDQWLFSLGANLPTDTGPEEASPLVLVLRSDLLYRFPNTVISAHRATWTGPTPAQGARTLDRAAAPLLPLFTSTLNPDVALVAFALTADQARGHVPSDAGDPVAADPGYFFVLSERPGQPRFGLDATPSTTFTTWDDLSWAAVTAPQASGPTYADADARVSPPTEAEGAAWGASSADLASILLRSPVMYARHADDLIRADAPPIREEGPA